MDFVRKKELETLLNNLDDKDIKRILSLFIESEEEIPIDKFFSEIKKIEKIESLDYKLILLLEEFYLRFKNN